MAAGVDEIRLEMLKALGISISKWPRTMIISRERLRRVTGEAVLEEELEEIHCGFRPRSGTTDQLLTQRLILRGSSEYA